MRSVILRAAGAAALQTDPQRQPPDGQSAQPQQSLTAGKRWPVVAADRSWQTMPFEEPLKTELKQMGVEPVSMSVGNLSAEAKEGLLKLDFAIERLAKGQLSDLPESMKVEALKLDNDSLSYSAAM